jgi:hypothetical protein
MLTDTGSAFHPFRLDAELVDVTPRHEVHAQPVRPLQTEPVDGHVARPSRSWARQSHIEARPRRSVLVELDERAQVEGPDRRLWHGAPQWQPGNRVVKASSRSKGSREMEPRSAARWQAAGRTPVTTGIRSPSSNSMVGPTRVGGPPACRAHQLVDPGQLRHRVTGSRSRPVDRECRPEMRRCRSMMSRLAWEAPW